MTRLLAELDLAHVEGANTTTKHVSDANKRSERLQSAPIDVIALSMKQSCCVSNDEAIRKKQSSGEGATENESCTVPCAL